MVAAPAHPLAGLDRPFTADDAADHVQLVLTDRLGLTGDRDFGVIASNTWRLGDLSPREWDGTADGPILPICAAWLAEAPPGPAGRWLIAFFEQQATAETA